MSAPVGTPAQIAASNERAREVAVESEEQKLERVMLSGGTPGTELVMRRGTTDVDSPITAGELELLYRLARGLAASGMFKDARQASQAFAKLIFARDLGLSATQGMTDIHIVEGKPEMSANLQASKVRASAAYEYRIVDLTPERCEIAFSRHGEELVPTSEFTMDDARQAGLVKKTSGGHDGMWEKYPRNMLFARAMSNGVAFHCPDVMNGIRVYAEGEIAAATDRVEVSVDIAVPEAQADASEPEDATVIDTPLSDEARTELVEAVDAAGVSIDVLLTAVGLDSTDDLTEAAGLQLREELGKLIAGGAS
jgi:hypothetical protein